MKAVKITIIQFLFWFGAVKTYSEEDALNEHNRLRKLHGVPLLKLSKSLSIQAAAYAQVRFICLMLDTKGEYSENLCFRIDDPETCTQYWYDEIKDYDFSNPGLTIKTAQFTKVVWAASAEFGWGQAQANNGFYFVVARYTPSGNVGSFEENVPRPLSPTSGGTAVLIKALIISICLGLLKLTY